MEYKAVLKDYRGSARKARLVVDLVRGKSVIEAQKILFLSKQKVAKQMYKLLNSAVANAKDLAAGTNDADLVVSKAYANEGRTAKRFRPRAQGRATTILKRSCHIYLFVKDITKEGE